MASSGDKVTVENVNHPGRTARLDRAKYEAMRDALLAVLPDAAPGMTVAAAHDALRPHLPQELFPGGATSGWWLKAVHLDLEAKGTLARTPRPVRLYSTGAD